MATKTPYHNDPCEKFQDGYVAFLEEREECDCPYSAGTESAEHWVSGWRWAEDTASLSARVRVAVSATLAAPFSHRRH